MLSVASAAEQMRDTVATVFSHIPRPRLQQLFQEYKQRVEQFDRNDADDDGGFVTMTFTSATGNDTDGGEILGDTNSNNINKDLSTPGRVSGNENSKAHKEREDNSKTSCASMSLSRTDRKLLDSSESDSDVPSSASSSSYNSKSKSRKRRGKSSTKRKWGGMFGFHRQRHNREGYSDDYKDKGSNNSSDDDEEEDFEGYDDDDDRQNDIYDRDVHGQSSLLHRDDGNTIKSKKKRNKSNNKKKNNKKKSSRHSYSNTSLSRRAVNLAALKRQHTKSKSTKLPTVRRVDYIFIIVFIIFIVVLFSFTTVFFT
uniref:Uncharacterized protein n=1 Tax=Lygus hesperus TaxID=30085 RepID=A0A0A9X499_LYGHE